jgi:uncharacterized membrane protein YGL010W
MVAAAKIKVIYIIRKNNFKSGFLVKLKKKIQKRIRIKTSKKQRRKGSNRRSQSKSHR